MSDESHIEYSRYVRGIEESLTKIPFKNGTVTIDDIHLETSLPYDLIAEILAKEDIQYPENLDEIIAE